MTSNPETYPINYPNVPQNVNQMQPQVQFQMQQPGIMMQPQPNFQMGYGYPMQQPIIAMQAQPVMMQPGQIIIPVTVPNMALTIPTLHIPMLLQCTKCNKQVQSVVTHRMGDQSWVMAIILGIFTCCCWIPCVFNECQDAHHTCPVCGSLLGIKKFGQ